jgi:FtsZ-binding cell division protein ZapB
MSRISPRSLQIVVGLTLSASALVLTGCDQRSPTATAVESASRDVLVVSGGGSARPESADYAKTMTGVASTAQGSANDGTAVEKAAANLLVSTAQLGLATGPAERAASKDLEARTLITRIQAFSNQWSSSSSSAAAAESFDPAAQISELNALRERKQGEIATLQSELTKVQTQVEGLRARAKERLDAAAAKHAIYTKMTSDAVSLSAADASKVVADANKIRREGDALRLDGSKIDAEAESIAPMIGELRMRVDELANQNKEFEKAQADLQARAETFRSQAKTARDDANTASNAIDALVGDLEKLFDGDLKAAFDDTVAAVNKSKSAASSSQTASPGFGKLATGESSLLLADAHWAKAESFGNFATTLEILAQVAPKLPYSDKYAESATKIRQVQAEALKEAASAYEAAESAFSGARVTGPVKERLEKLSELIKKAQTVTSDANSDVAATFGIPKRVQNVKAAKDDASGDAAAIEVDPALTTRVGEFVDSMKAGETNLDFITGSEPIVKMVEASGNLDRKLRAKFQSSFAEAMGPMGQGTLNPRAFESLTAQDATITMKSPTSAVVAFSGVPELPFSKVDGAWKMDMMAMLGPNAAMTGMIAGPMTTVLNDLAAEVEAGKFADLAAFQAALGEKMMNMMGPK